MNRSSHNLAWSENKLAAGSGWRSFDGLKTLVPLGVVLCVGAAVLLFGGVEPRALTAIEAIVLLIFAVSLWIPEGRSAGGGMPWQGPAALLALVGMQALLLSPLNQYFSGQVLRLVLYLCIFLLLARFGRPLGVRKRLLQMFVWVGMLEALYGTVLFLSGSEKILYIDKFVYLNRATGTYVNPNHFANLLGLVLPVAMGACFHNLEKLRSERNAVKVNEYFWGAVFYATSAMIMFVGIVLSQSRLGLVAVLAAIFATGLISLAASWNRKGIALALGVFLLLSAFTGLWIGVEPIATRYEILGEDYEGRRAIWTDAMGIVRERPLLGSGLGSFRVEYTKHQRVYLEYVVDHAHNDYLQFAAELGIPGALLLFGMILWVLVRGTFLLSGENRPPDWLRAAGLCGAIVALLVHSLGDFNLQIPANAMMFAAFLGLLHASTSWRHSQLRTSRQEKTEAKNAAG